MANPIVEALVGLVGAKPAALRSKAAQTFIEPTPTGLPVSTTQFAPELENLYQLWSQNNRVPQSRDYDMRGFFMGMLQNDPAATTAVDPSDMQLHFSDKWKLPSHRSFSRESMYSRSPQDPQWVENPAPYVDGTWARVSPLKGTLNVDLPLR